MSRVIIGHWSFWRRVFAVNHLIAAGTDKRERTGTNYKTQTNATHKMALINNNTKHSKT